MTTSFHWATGRALRTRGRSSIHSSSGYVNWTIHLPDHHFGRCPLKAPGARLALESMLGARPCAGAGKVLVVQSCLTLCDPMDCSPPRLPCPWNSSDKNTGVGCHSLLQGIFPTQGSNLGLLQADYLPSEPSGKPVIYRREHFIGGLRCLNPTFIQVYYL